MKAAVFLKSSRDHKDEEQDPLMHGALAACSSQAQNENAEDQQYVTLQLTPLLFFFQS